MKNRKLPSALSLAACLCCAPLAFAQSDPDSVAAAATASGTFLPGKGTFLLNGQPFVVKAAELHYPRIPRQYWEHRIQMCKALGMNTICLYTFWNIHEPKPGEFDFTGNNDLAEFIRLCQANGMYVILRPGPYVCAEWEMGGLPWWLLRDKDIRLRESDPRFLERVDLFQQEVARQTRGLTIADGGPIIMVQVENEYGSYGKDKPYVATIRDMLRRNFGPDVTMFQCDWSSNFLDNGLDDLVWTLNFGTGADIDGQFAPLKEARPDSPLMCSEFWSGWFDKWGANHETRPADEMIAGLDEMLSKGISFSLYMTHGGTNWGHWAGANSPGYAPDVTSYDYDAPVNEQGAPTPKYHLLRQMMARHTDGPLPDVPQSIPVGRVARARLSDVAPLWANLPQGRADSVLRSMEEYDQGFGSIMYRTAMPEAGAGDTLSVTGAHDYAQVFINGRHIGTLDRRLGDDFVLLPATVRGDTLDILVEAMGRINFGRAIKDFKGLTGEVSVDRRDGSRVSLTSAPWTVFNLPDREEFYTSMSFVPADNFAPDAEGRWPRGVYRGSFTVERPADTFLDMSTWGKGLVYVNGHALGRFWEIGPQQTLYTPGCWLREGENEIVVFDILGPRDIVVEGLDAPVLDRLQPSQSALHRAPGEELDLADAVPVATGSFVPGNGWQEARFGRNATGRFVCLELLDAIDGGNETAVAELYMLDGDGNRLPREAWKVRYADAENPVGNHTADKAFDLQESTYWSTGAAAPLPHALVIDLGEVQTVGGLQLLPRMEAGAPGAPGRFRVFVSPDDFKYNN